MFSVGGGEGEKKKGRGAISVREATFKDIKLLYELMRCRSRWSKVQSEKRGGMLETRLVGGFLSSV